MHELPGSVAARLRRATAWLAVGALLVGVAALDAAPVAAATGSVSTSTCGAGAGSLAICSSGGARGMGGAGSIWRMNPD